MYSVYILKSMEYNRHYIGQTVNLVARLKKHNKGYVKSTKGFRPWKLLYFENYNTRSEACRRELEIKEYKGGIKFKRLLES